MPKSTQTRKRGSKSEGKYTKPHASSPLSDCEKMYRWMKLCIFSVSVLQLVSRVIEDQENGGLVWNTAV